MTDSTETTAPLFSSTVPDIPPRHGNNMKFGENGNAEYTWSTYFQEKIVQLSFQLTRTSDPSQMVLLGNKYNELIQEAFLSNQLDYLTRQKYISILYRIMLHTRDIIDGKGEYALFYMLLSEWVKVSEQLKKIDVTDNSDTMNKKIECIESLTSSAVESLVFLETQEHPYGSWKDMKYLLNYLRSRRDIPTRVYDLPIFKHIISVIVKQLGQDACGLNPPSLLAKWLPREKSRKFGWIAKHIACQYYSHWLIANTTTITSKDNNCIILSSKNAERKCLTHYRQLIASLNRSLNTVQINQCNHTWRDINFEKNVSSITMSRQKNAFQNRNNLLNDDRHNIDRIICKTNYESYVKKCMMGDVEMKGKRTSIIDLVKDALEIVDMELRLKRSGGYVDDSKTKINKETINLQWKESGKNLNSLQDFIPLIDTSGSMEGEPLLAALGLGCRIAEQSRLGKRAITFSSTPEWIDLSECDTLIEMVERLATHKNWGMNTNFVASLQLILDASIERELTPDDTGNLTLVIFSDMQIDQADKNTDTMHTVIEKMFYDAGLRSKYATPFKVPRIVYWNLRSTSGFPTVSFVNNVSMLSGFSPIIMNTLTEKGADGLKECTPWEILRLQLGNKRYEWVDEKLQSLELFSKDAMIDDPVETIYHNDKTTAPSGWLKWW